MSQVAKERRGPLTHDLAGLSFGIVGLVRNCERTVEDDVKRISAALQGAASVRWFVVESDSNDNTLAELEELKRASPRFDYVSLGDLTPTLPARTERLAHCRNRYVEELLLNPLYRELDFVIVADLDGVNRLISRASVASCFERDDWDACFANQRGPYYDIWALRHPLWNPADCWENFRLFKSIGVTPRTNWRASVFSKMITIPTEARWIEVDSAFGGFGIYRSSVFRRANYEGIAENGASQSEHVSFNASLKAEGFRLCINPKLINARFTEHSFRARWWGWLAWEAERVVSLAYRCLRKFMPGVARPTREFSSG